MINGGGGCSNTTSDRREYRREYYTLSLSRLTWWCWLYPVFTHDAHCVLSSKLWRKNLELGTLLVEDQLVGEDFVAELEEEHSMGGGCEGVGWKRERCWWSVKSCNSALAALIDCMGGERWCRLRQSLFVWWRCGPACETQRMIAVHRWRLKFVEG